MAVVVADLYMNVTKIVISSAELNKKEKEDLLYG